MSNGFAIEVIYVDGRKARFDFALEQATIGSDPTADLCIPLDELSPKHMLVVPRENGCWISVARGVNTPVLYAGQYVDSQEVPWGAELDVGTITLRIGESTDVVRARSQSHRSLLRIGGLAMLALLVLFLLQEEEVRVPRAPASAPSLFDEDPVKCSVAAAERVQRSKDLRVAATAYWQRYPFDAQEGIRASQLFAEASDCYSILGDKESAEEMSSERQTLFEQVNRDYQTLRLQLSRALKNKDHGHAKMLVKRLANFVQHRPGPYFDWLVRVKRYLRNRS